MSVSAAGDGIFRDFSTSSGTTHYTLLTSNCSGASYTYATTSASADSYRLSLFAIPLGSTITAIEITPCAASYNGASAVMQAFYVANGTASATAGRYDLSAGAPATLAPTIFSGLSILRTTAATLEAGVRLTGGTGGVKLGGLSARITYTPSVFPAPSNLTAASLSSTEIGLNWADNTTSETGFRIERSLNGTNSWTLIAIGVPNVRSYRDTNLSSDQNYYYRVKAINTTTGQQTDFSNTANAITYATPPAAPRNLWLAQSATSATLSWMRTSNNDDGTAVERSTNGVQFQEIGRAATGASTYTDLVGASSGPVYYRVRAFNRKGYSAYSNTASNTQTLSNGPDLRVSLQARSTSAGGKQTTFFTVNYANAGNAQSQNAYLSATVPDGTTFDVAASSPKWQCLNPNADAFKLKADIARALRAFKMHYPNLQQVFISNHHYNGYASTGVVEPMGYETGFAAKWAIEAQMEQVRSGRVDPLTDNLDYRTGIAPWAAWGPYLWANGTTPNGQGLFSDISEFGADLVHPNALGQAKFGRLMLNYFLSAPYTAWLRNQGEAAIPILPVPLPKPNPTALIDLPTGGLYLGLPGGLYPNESNMIPDDHFAAGMAAAARIQPLDGAGQPSPTGQVVLMSVGYSNSLTIFQGFMDLAKTDSRINVQSATGRDTRASFRLLQGATGGASALAWADPNHEVYGLVKQYQIEAWGYTENQVQAIWFNAAHSAGPTYASPLSGTAAGTVCTLPLGAMSANASGNTTFAVRTNLTRAQTVSFSVSALDDGTAGVDLWPPDNAAQATFTVLP